ncbi:MAG: hypothetical protein II349_07595 [Akkermansia sp.]|nr:hypothetical protein [Akkermansia sp.]
MMWGSPAAIGQEVGVPFVADMPDDEAAEEIVETVKLGGEDNAPTMQEGVEQAASYEHAADPDSPTNVETSGAAQDESTLDALKPTTSASDPTVHDPSRVAYATNRKNARTMSLTVPGPRGIIRIAALRRNGCAIPGCSWVSRSGENPASSRPRQSAGENF